MFASLRHLRGQPAKQRFIGARSDVLMAWTKKHPVEPGVKSPVKEREGTCGASCPEKPDDPNSLKKQVMLSCKTKF